MLELAPAEVSTHDPMEPNGLALARKQPISQYQDSREWDGHQNDSEHGKLSRPMSNSAAAVASPNIAFIKYGQ